MKQFTKTTCDKKQMIICKNALKNLQELKNSTQANIELRYKQSLVSFNNILVLTIKSQEYILQAEFKCISQHLNTIV